MLTLIIAFLVAAIANLLLIRFSFLHENLTGDLLTGPQKFHAGVVPRVGGIGIFLGMIAGGLALFFRPAANKPEIIFVLLAVTLPAFLSGLSEDFTKRIPPWARMLGALISAGLGFVFLGAAIQHVGIAGLDHLLMFWPLAFALTIFAVAGMAHAINIIDGFNGLSAGVALLILLAFAYVAFKVHDLAVFHICLAAGGAILGFLIWNYPAGLIFLGDGGAYLVGVVIAEAAVLLVARNPQISPWFPLLVVIYPIFETLYTVYRRAFVRREALGEPDALHLHSLIYRRLLGWMLSSNLEARNLIRRNAMTSFYLWGLTCLCVIPAVIVYNRTYFLMGFVGLFACFYVWMYTCIVKFKTPVWLRRLFLVRRDQHAPAK